MSGDLEGGSMDVDDMNGRPAVEGDSGAAEGETGANVSSGFASAVGLPPKRERDAEAFDEIPADVLADALGARRSGRKTKARVIMIDGEPVLRSNNYTLTEGEPSVFDAELGEETANEEGRTRYVFEQQKEKRNYVRKKPRAPKVETEDEVKAGKNNKEILKAIEDAQARRSKYLKAQIKHLEPFITPQVKNSIFDRAERYDESQKGPQKVLMPVENQPSMIKAVLREYQLEGLRWNVGMYDQGCSCILADEMGLGKTLQSISFLCALKEMRHANGPHLVVCPLSVLSSWMDELQKWAPSLRVVRLHSGDENERVRLRKEVVPNTESYDVAVTTYEMACNPAFNVTLTQKVMWRTMILDEGHRVKNEETAAHQVLKRVKRQHTLLLTGTPVQNNLHELYAILSFLHPDVFTSSDPFDKAFNLNTSEHKVDSQLLEKAHFLMRPFILRRVKGEVEVSLPPKTETKIMCPLSEAQTFWYRRLLLREATALQSLEKATKGEGGADNFQKLNSLLMQLRKCCNHPFLFSGTDVPEDGVPVEELIEASGKLAVLDRMLQKLKNAGHRVVLFSQFTSMLDILQDFLTLKGYTYARLDGSTNRVQRSIDIAAFNRPDSPLFAFLLSTRAGGLGVNLQTADTCVLFDSDWNPQVDLQAMARVHRIGQKKEVHIYRLVTAGTVEERMTQRAEKKLFLEQMVSRGSTKAAEQSDNLDRNDLYAMLRFGVDQVFSKSSGDPPTDEELDILMDRSSKGAERRKKLGNLQADVTTAEDYIEGKAEAAPISTFMLPSAIASELGVSEDAVSEAKSKQYKSVKDIAAEWNANLMQGKRSRTKTTIEIDGHTVLKVNNYSMEEGEPSVYERESRNSKPKGGPESKKPRSQIAGRDYGHSSVCQSCWDGGEIVCCDLCPVSVHPDCIGITMKDITRYHRWSCPHHSCHECGRKAAAVGGILFRCEACPRAFCEDHLPGTAEIIGQCKRFQDLGQNHPAQACFIHCDAECAKWAETHIAEEFGKTAEGWSIGKKVAITDHWIEERDAELELPVENGTKTKPLAHATFTDLVQFLLRNEGPKKGGKKIVKKKSKAVEEVIDPQPGDLLEMRGVLCYYTKSGENVAAVSEMHNVDWKDIIEWNTGWIQGAFYGKGTYLLEGTRLWLAPPPRKTLDELSEEERIKRVQEEREAAMAAAAMGLPGASQMLNEGEVTVLGRGLKGLRQKDLLPAERDEIVTEMFKRVRPLLEKKIAAQKKQQEEAAKKAAMSAEEERHRAAERNARTARRGDGLPSDSFLAADLTTGDRMPSRRGAPPPIPAIHGGEITGTTLEAIKNSIIRSLHMVNATASGDYCLAMMLMVRLARGHAGTQLLTDMRTRWTSPIGEDLGFTLGIIALEREGALEMELHHKYPENLELSSMRLSTKAVIPPKPKGEQSQEAPKQSRATSSQFVMENNDVKVQCGDLDGILRPGAKRGDEGVEYVDAKGDTHVVPAVEFERLGGRGSTRKWRQSIRLAVEGVPAADITDDSKRGIPIGKFLRDEGAAYRESVVGRVIEMWSPEVEEYHPGLVIDYKADSGEHEILYHDGNREWIYFCMTQTRWPDGLPSRIAAAEKPTKKAAEKPEKEPKRGRAAAMVSTEAILNGYRVFVLIEKSTLEQVSEQVGITIEELLEFNAPYFAKLTATTKLAEETKVYLQPGPDPEELTAMEVVETAFEEAQNAEREAQAKIAAKEAAKEAKEKAKAKEKEIAKAKAAKAKAAKGKKGKKARAPSPPPKRKGKPIKRATSKKAKYVDDDDEYDDDDDYESEEDEESDDEYDSDEDEYEDEDDEEFTVSKSKRPKYTEEELAAMLAAEFQLELEAQCIVRGSAVPIECGGLTAVLTGANLSVLYSEPKKKTVTEMDIPAFMKLAKVKGRWQDEITFNGTGDMKGHPVIHYLAARGLAIGRAVIGSNVDILPRFNAMQFLPAKIVSYDEATGSHEVRYFGKGEDELEKIHLPLVTLRWLPKLWEPYSAPDAVKVPDAEGGIVFALRPIPIGCGGMRGILLPGGKRGEEMVRYCQMRRERERCVVEELTIPATEFERLSGKGTAKKWRQSVRVVDPDYKLGDSVSKLLKAVGEVLGSTVVGRELEVFWPGDECFYYGAVEGFRAESGEHEIMYDDGNKEILQIAMQTVRWSPMATVRKASASTQPGAKPIAAKPKEKPKTSWIQCDSCEKWRIVPQTYMDTLGEDDAWKCTMNPDSAKSARGCDAPEDKE